MKVECQIQEVAGPGSAPDVVVATCNRCNHETESFGTSDESRRRCLALMREECPRGERNFYVDAADDEPRAQTPASCYITLQHEGGVCEMLCARTNAAYSVLPAPSFCPGCGLAME